MSGPTLVDLVLDTGELVRIECPTKFEDELHDSIANTLKLRDWWAPGRFDGCTATFMGMRIDRVNMARVVATL